MTAYTKVIGSAGDRIDLLISKGDTFGPHELTLTNPDGTPVDLTGCTLVGWVRANPTAPKTDLDVAIANEVGGIGTFGLTADATGSMRSGDHPTSPDSLYIWALKLVDSQGRRLPVFYGQARVQAS